MSKSTKAKEYVKEHNIEGLVKDMVNSLLHSNTDEKPTVYMIKYLTGLLSESDRTKAGINIKGPFPEKYVKGKPNQPNVKQIIEPEEKVDIKNNDSDNIVNAENNLENNEKDITEKDITEKELEKENEKELKPESDDIEIKNEEKNEDS
jgi:hypothetical protein